MADETKIRRSELAVDLQQKVDILDNLSQTGTTEPTWVVDTDEPSQIINRQFYFNGSAVSDTDPANRIGLQWVYNPSAVSDQILLPDGITTVTIPPLTGAIVYSTLTQSGVSWSLFPSASETQGILGLGYQTSPGGVRQLFPIYGAQLNTVAEGIHVGDNDFDTVHGGFVRGYRVFDYQGQPYLNLTKGILDFREGRGISLEPDQTNTLIVRNTGVIGFSHGGVITDFDIDYSKGYLNFQDPTTSTVGQNYLRFSKTVATPLEVDSVDRTNLELQFTGVTDVRLDANGEVIRPDLTGTGSLTYAGTFASAKRIEFLSTPDIQVIRDNSSTAEVARLKFYSQQISIIPNFRVADLIELRPFTRLIENISTYQDNSVSLTGTTGDLFGRPEGVITFSSQDLSGFTPATYYPTASLTQAVGAIKISNPYNIYVDNLGSPTQFQYVDGVSNDFDYRSINIDIRENGIKSKHIAPNQVTDTHILSVDGSKITGQIGPAQLPGLNSIDGSLIVDNSISASKISSVDALDIANTSSVAIGNWGGNLAGGRIVNNTLGWDKLKAPYPDANVVDSVLVPVTFDPAKVTFNSDGSMKFGQGTSGGSGTVNAGVVLGPSFTNRTGLFFGAGSGISISAAPSGSDAIFTISSTVSGSSDVAQRMRLNNLPNGNEYAAKQTGATSTEVFVVATSGSAGPALVGLIHNQSAQPAVNICANTAKIAEESLSSLRTSSVRVVSEPSLTATSSEIRWKDVNRPGGYSGTASLSTPLFVDTSIPLSKVIFAVVPIANGALYSNNVSISDWLEVVGGQYRIITKVVSTTGAPAVFNFVITYRVFWFN